MGTKILAGTICSGKTTELIKLSHQTFAYIVCSSYKNAIQIQRQSIELGLEIPHPITYQEFIEGKYYGKGIKGFLIDEIEWFLRYISKVPIIAFTSNSENITILSPKLTREHLEYKKMCEGKLENA